MFIVVLIFIKILLNTITMMCGNDYLKDFVKGFFLINRFNSIVPILFSTELAFKLLGLGP